jgi:hypothetical protein
VAALILGLLLAFVAGALVAYVAIFRAFGAAGG